MEKYKQNITNGKMKIGSFWHGGRVYMRIDEFVGDNQVRITMGTGGSTVVSITTITKFSKECSEDDFKKARIKLTLWNLER
jgi:hypothetical protein